VTLLASASNYGVRRLIAHELEGKCQMVIGGETSLRWHGTGIGEIVSLWTNRQMLPSILQVWFWLTPIAWTGTQLPSSIRTLLALNPAGYVVSGYRHALMPKIFPAPTALESAAFWITCLGILMIGATCFRRLRGHFWDCL
jgi:hypothetical protein